MSRTHNTIRYNALTRKALAHGYRDAEEYLRHTPRLRHRLHECPVGRTCPQCSDNRRHAAPSTAYCLYFRSMRKSCAPVCVTWTGVNSVPVSVRALSNLSRGIPAHVYACPHVTRHGVLRQPSCHRPACAVGARILFWLPG